MQDSVDEGRKITVVMKSINDIITELKPERIDILKINIESSEYDVIEYILDIAISIGQILI